MSKVKSDWKTLRFFVNDCVSLKRVFVVSNIREDGSIVTAEMIAENVKRRNLPFWNGLKRTVRGL